MRLFERFDALALSPFALPAAGTGAPSADPSQADATPGEQAAAAWPQLHAWCLAEAAAPMRVAWSAQPDAATLAAALALHLDGSHTLQACGGALARLALRARVKLHDLQTPRRGAVGSERAGDGSLPFSRIWDSGRAQGDATALARFRPRRPSLVVIDSLSQAGRDSRDSRGNDPEQHGGAALRAAVLALQAAAGEFSHPLRVLWCLGEPLPAWQCLDA